MTEGIIIALITAGFPILATIISSKNTKKIINRNAAKQSIFSLINDDKTDALYGKMPSNYQNVLNEYDIYHKNGGNSYVTEKVEDYKKWYVAWGHQHIDK